MHEDKLIRPAADSGVDTHLLAVAKRAAMCHDENTMAKVVEQLGAMFQVARASGDKILIERCHKLVCDLEKVMKDPTSVFTLETKALAANERREHDDSAERQLVKRGSVAGRIKGYGAVFGNRDLVGDIIVPGAFLQSLAKWKAKGRLPPMLAQHEHRQFPVGAWTSMFEDKTGLRVEGMLADTPRGREVQALVTMYPAALDGLSIGFNLPDAAAAAHDAHRGVRLLKVIDLWEVSIVSLPANPLARIDTGKAAAGMASSEAYDKLTASLDHLRELFEEQAAAESADNVIPFPTVASDTLSSDEARQLQELAAMIRRETSMRA